jgi:CubicO group peptidase (beta-lactamase class C family)
LLLLVLVAGGAMPVHGQPSGSENDAEAERPAWLQAEPPRFGFDRAALDSLVGRAEALSPLNSLLIARGDTTVVAWTAPGMRTDRPTNVKSASKTILSALVGLAIADGHLDGVDQPIGPFFPDVLDGSAPGDSTKRQITLRDLLTMQAGLESTSFGNYGAWVSSRDWARDALDRDLVGTPGDGMIYSTGTSHLVAVILAKAIGRPLRDYAQKRLFDPLGVEIGSWQKSPQGYYFGGNNLALSPEGLLRFGQLYLRGGLQSYESGTAILPPMWIADSWRVRVTRSYRGFRYGYLWWIEDFGGHRTYFAWGYGGQMLFVVPTLDLVAVMTSSLTNRPDDVSDHSGRLFRFFETVVAPASVPEDRHQRWY